MVDINYLYEISPNTFGSLNYFLFFICRVAEALILGTMMVGQATAFAPNYNKAVLASARVFKLLDRRPLIDGDGQSGLRLVSFYSRLFVVRDQSSMASCKEEVA